MNLSNNLQTNIDMLKNTFKKDKSLVFREFSIGGIKNVECAAVFLEGMVDLGRINSEIIKPLMDMTNEETETDIYFPSVMKNKIPSAQVETTNGLDKVINFLLSGYTVVLIDGYDNAIGINTMSMKRRNISEPESEKIVRGPRDGFNESLFSNITLIRTKIKSEDLKFQFKELGRITKTKVCMCYLENIASQEIVNEVERRLDKIDIDGILDSGYIQELIEDAGYSPFMTIGYTERPDTVAGKLLEGHIAILCDSSPVALTLPFLFVEYFIVNEDYYNNFYYASFNRLLSWLGFFLTTSIPAIYCAIITFHQEMLPTPFILSISAARQGVPLPTIAEMILILFVFEILREASVRIPAVIGQTISIVGALIIGQAAVEARLISAPIIIVAAASGMTSFLVPKMEQAVIIVRLLFLLSSAFMGLYGYIFCSIILFIHLTSMKTFGIPYMLFGSSLLPQDQKDVVFRAPWWNMKRRPRLIASKNMNRQKKLNIEWMINMKRAKVILLIILIYICACLLSGCWNYREIDQYAIVSGVAVDKSQNGKVLITVEIANMQQQQQGKSVLKPVYVQAEGDTSFYAIRSIVALQGRRLYWSHAKIIIISEGIAKVGISKVLDFVSRDAEIREDMWILLSSEKSASEILNTKSELETILSFEIDNTLRAQESVSRFPAVELYDFLDILQSKKQSAVIPTVKVVNTIGRPITYLSGAAIIKHDKLAGYLNEDESKSMLWIQDKLKGGLFVVKKLGESGTIVTLEILKSKTKVKPEIEDGKLIIKIALTVDVNIGEIMGNEDFISKKGRDVLEKEAEKQIKEQLEALIEKSQKELKSDFLGFGTKVKHSMPKVWKTIEDQWEKYYEDLDISIEVNVRLKGSATTRKPIKAGE